MMDGDGGWWIWMSIWMIVFWGLVIVGVFAIANWLRDSRQEQESAEETLRRRLASGEIDEERYRVLLDELRGKPHGPTAPAR